MVGYIGQQLYWIGGGFLSSGDQSNQKPKKPEVQELKEIAHKKDEETISKVESNQSPRSMKSFGLGIDDDEFEDAIDYMNEDLITD